MMMGMMPLLMALMIQGMGSDLLDYMPTAAYWKAKNVKPIETALLLELGQGERGDPEALISQLGSSAFRTRESATVKLRAMGRTALPALKKAAASDDVEISARARSIIKGMTGAEGGKAGDIRRLMAIRTLGEIKSKKALPVLQALTKSQQLFVADYATQAIALIKQVPYERSLVTTKQFDQDIACLPKGCALIAHTRGLGQIAGKPGGWMNKMGAAMALFEGPGDGRADMEQQMVRAILMVAEQIGNVRLDGFSVGVSGDVGDDTGFVAFIARGTFDAKAIRAVVQKQGSATETVNGIEFMGPEDEMRMAVLSNHRAVLLAGPDREHLPVAEIAAALKDNAPKLRAEKAVVALLNKVDRTSPAWAVVSMTKNFQQIPFFAPFDSGILTTRSEDDMMHVKLVATGKNAQALQQSVQTLQTGHQEMLREINEGMADGAAGDMFEMMKPGIDFIKSITFHIDGTTVTIKASIKGGAGSLMSMPMMWMGMMFSFRMGHVPEDVMVHDDNGLHQEIEIRDDAPAVIIGP